MQLLSKILGGLFLSLVFICCSSKNRPTKQSVIQGDSLKVIVESRGDTTIKEYIRLDNKIGKNHEDTFIYTKRTIDNTIAKSNFYFTADKGFKIYFDKQKVIAYCDSELALIPPDKDGELVNWSIADGWQALKKIVQSDKKMEGIRESWLPDLLKRFDPLITNDSTSQITKFFLTEKVLSKYHGYTNHFSISKQGDTSLIWHWTDFIAVQIEYDDP